GFGTLLVTGLGSTHADRRRIRHLDGLGLTAEGEVRLVVLLGLLVPALDVDNDDLARIDTPEKDLFRELVLDLTLDRATQRTGTQHRVEATLGKQPLRLRSELQLHVLGLELILHP